MFTVTNKRQGLSIKEKVKLMQEIENGKEKADVSGMWLRKFCYKRDMVKENQNY
jgi:hypothetical protein